MSKRNTYCEELTHNFCCGVGEIGQFEKDDHPFHFSGNINAIARPGCGIFTSTFLNTTEGRRFYREMKALYPILWESKYLKNLGPDASSDGATKGVKLVVFQWKEQADATGK